MGFLDSGGRQAKSNGGSVGRLVAADVTAPDCAPNRAQIRTPGSWIFVRLPSIGNLAGRTITTALRWSSPRGALHKYLHHSNFRSRGRHGIRKMLASVSARWQTTSSTLHLPGIGRATTCSRLMPATGVAELRGPGEVGIDRGDCVHVRLREVSCRDCPNLSYGQPYRDPAAEAGLARTEQLGMLRDVIADARRGPSDDRLDVVGEPIVPVVGVELGHRQQVAGEMLRQIPRARSSRPATRSNGTST